MQVALYARVSTERQEQQGTVGRIPDFPEQCVGKDGL